MQCRVSGLPATLGRRELPNRGPLARLVSREQVELCVLQENQSEEEEEEEVFWVVATRKGANGAAYLDSSGKVLPLPRHEPVRIGSLRQKCEAKRDLEGKSGKGIDNGTAVRPVALIWLLERERSVLAAGEESLAFPCWVVAGEGELDLPLLEIAGSVVSANVVAAAAAIAGLPMHVDDKPTWSDRAGSAGVDDDVVFVASSPAKRAAPIGRAAGESAEKRQRSFTLDFGVDVGVDEAMSDAVTFVDPPGVQRQQQQVQRQEQPELLAAAEQQQLDQHRESVATEMEFPDATPEKVYCDLSNAVDQASTVLTFEDKSQRLRASLHEKSDRSGTFLNFTDLCKRLGNESSYTAKTAMIQKFLTDNPDPADSVSLRPGPRGAYCDHYHLCRLLMCREDRRIFGIKERMFARHMSKLLTSSLDKDAANDALSDEIYREFSTTGELGAPIERHVDALVAKHPLRLSKDALTLAQANTLLTSLHLTTSHEQQLQLLSEVFWCSSPKDPTKSVPRLNGTEWRWLWKLLSKDLKINIGPKYVLKALAGGKMLAFDAYQRTQNLEIIITRKRRDELGSLAKETKNKPGDGAKTELKRASSISVFQPIKPMLARQVSGAQACAKHCPNGMVAEIKYDGERLQLHYDATRSENKFQFFSRNLKNVPKWKTVQVEAYVLQSIGAAAGDDFVQSCVLDGEILLIDTRDHKPLPFGTLNVHKQTEFRDACVCVYWFDILFLNGKSLLTTPLKERRRLLQEHICVVTNRMELSEQHWLGFANPEATALHVREDNNLKPDTDLANKQFDSLMARAMAEGLEGLVVKDALSIYGPGQRHWNKIKKDYIAGMADTADLLVLGGYYGTGTKGGLISIFLMGTHDPKTCTAGLAQQDIRAHKRCFKTVTRVGNGFDDASILRLQCNLRDEKNGSSLTDDVAITWVATHKVFESIADLAPWLNVDRMLTPDFVVHNPLLSPVWEIAGAEFSKTLRHTADGISIRFPRLTAERDDKSWGDATNLDELKTIVQVGEATKPRPFTEADEFSETSLFGAPRSAPSVTSAGSDEGLNPAHSSQRSHQAVRFAIPLPGRPEIRQNPDQYWSSRRTTELTMSGTELQANHNSNITSILEELGLNEKNTGSSVKHKAYMKAAMAIQLHSVKLASGAEAQKLDGVGRKIAKKIDEIIATGTLKRIEKDRADERLQSVHRLCKIQNVGPTKAIELVDKFGITDIASLRAKLSDSSLPSNQRPHLHRVQQLGVELYEDLNERIPREEVALLLDFVRGHTAEIDQKLDVQVCGSFRRGKPDCGDVDMLLTHPDYDQTMPVPHFLSTLLARLRAATFITHDISNGVRVYHGVCRLPVPGSKHRRIDIQWTPADQFAFAQLYFTGSGFFNIQMRRISLEHGFTLSEQEILPIGQTGLCGDPVICRTERDIFDLLGMTWREPPDRDLAPNWKPTMS